MKRNYIQDCYSKMFIILVLLTILISIETTHSSTIEDVQNTLLEVQTTLGFNFLGSAVKKPMHIDCDEKEIQIYQNSTIATTEFVAFVFSAVWMENDFSLENFFDDVDFVAECQSLGGEVVEVDINLGCNRQRISFANYKLCKPQGCDTFEYLMTKRMVFRYFESQLQCSIDLYSDLIPSQQCFDGITKTYSNTDLSDYSPESFLTGEIASHVEVRIIVRLRKVCILVI